MTEDISPTLSVDNYTIERVSEGYGIFTKTEQGGKEWIATTSDPVTGMRIVEGLILVEMKRFYYPESTPVMNTKSGNPLPPFLKKGAEKL